MFTKAESHIFVCGLLVNFSRLHFCDETPSFNFKYSQRLGICREIDKRCHVHLENNSGKQLAALAARTSITREGLGVIL